MDHPQPYRDTDPRAMEVLLGLLRRTSPGEKFAGALEMSDLVFNFVLAGVRQQYPLAGEREVFLRAAARHLSRELMIRAYRWDPELHEQQSSSYSACP